MGIKVKLFGLLKEKIEGDTTETGFPRIIQVDSADVRKVKDIIEKFSIEPSELGHIFVNNRYAGINKNVKEGDIVGLFPRKNMSLLYKWYFHKEEDE
ncbi:MAG: MoaD/ThiS family protein [Promethearchaeota archaeon]